MTWKAVVVMKLSKVCVQAIFVFIEPATWFTISMVPFIMVDEVEPIVEMIVTVLAIEMARALYPMLFETRPCRKISVTTIADIVIARITTVLSKCMFMWEETFTTTAVGHVSKEKSGKWQSQFVSRNMLFFNFRLNLSTLCLPSEV